jgi:pectate lyase
MQEAGGGGCMTGNPIDDCWRCAGTNWWEDRQRLADCGIGFGRNALGGKGGPYYVVTDPSDRDPVNPSPGTLRHAAIQEGPLWITFARDMTIRLNEELLVNSYKTLDGRGASVHVAGGACITLQYVSNVIIHNLHVHDCVPAGNANVRSSPTHAGWRTRSDGDGISLFSARDVWVDHCALWRCADGLVDAIMGTTAVTVSNSYFAHHDEVMLLGHSDGYAPDSGMQVTVAFNHFGLGLVQRMPRCRRGYFHIVNNDYTAWQMYAIGGSASPTINSQGNRYIAPANPNAKEVRVSVLLCRVSGGSLSRFLPPAMFLGLGFALFFALLCFAWQVSVWSFGCKYVYRTRGGCQSAVAIVLFYCPKKLKPFIHRFVPRYFLHFFWVPLPTPTLCMGTVASADGPVKLVSLIGDCPWYFLVPDVCFLQKLHLDRASRIWVQPVPGVASEARPGCGKRRGHGHPSR